MNRKAGKLPARKGAMRVAIYARQSKSTEDANSIPVQLNDCRRWAKENSHTIVGEYVDAGKSGWNPKVERERYEQMIADLEAGKFDAPLARDTERLLRQDKEGARWLELGAAKKVTRLLFADEDAIDFGKARSREAFKNRVAGAVAYSERLQEKINSSLSERAADGYFTGRRPYGYDIAVVLVQIPGDDEPQKRRNLVIREDEARAIRKAAKDVLNKVSLFSVALEWNREGRTTNQGKPWTGGKVKELLQRPVYAGLREYRDQVVGDAKWDAIIDKRTWQALRDLFDGRTVADRGERYELTGILTCAEHGTPLTGRPSNGRRTYICAHAQNTADPSRHDGVHNRIRSEELETFLREQAEVRTVPAVVVNDPRDIDAELLRERDTVDARLAAWAREAALAGLSAPEIAEGRRALESERKRLDAEIAEQASSTVTWTDAYTGATDVRQLIASRAERILISERKPGQPWAEVESRVRIVWREGVVETNAEGEIPETGIPTKVDPRWFAIPEEDE